VNLKEILYRVSIQQVFGKLDEDILSISFDSNNSNKSSLFVAIKGAENDGHKYIAKAIENGAIAIICEDIPVNLIDNKTYIKVEDSHKALSVVASNFYNNPSNSIKLVGVTGTNGKTTIVELSRQLFTKMGLKVGMLSTIENRIVDKIIPTNLTTPDPLEINRLLREMVDQGCEYCFMEVSSHAIYQYRTHSLNFSAGIFTNITHDHLDYHKSFTEYIRVKKMFFDSLSESSFALINKDDRNYKKMIESTKAKTYTYSLKSVSDYKCKIIECQFEGMLLSISQIDVWVKLLGDFNAYNLLAVYSIANLFGYEDHQILKCLSLLSSASGRFQYLRSKDDIIGIVDYAHTEDALKNIISSINKIRTNTEQLITVFGCGGDRDKLKRPLMTSLVCHLSDQIIITNDNPRYEDPNSIIKDMLKDLDPFLKKKVLVINDRRQAIKTACTIASKKDIVLVAGKGHEKYQEVNGEKLHFDDLEELKKSLNII